MSYLEGSAEERVGLTTLLGVEVFNNYVIAEIKRTTRLGVDPRLWGLASESDLEAARRTLVQKTCMICFLSFRARKPPPDVRR
jgi:hypothetical protein